MSDLHSELDRARRERDRLTVIIEYLEERLGEPHANGDRPRRLTVAQAAFEVLGREQQPMRTPDLLAAVQDLGGNIKDADGLGKSLRRDPRFTQPSRGLWALA